MNEPLIQIILEVIIAIGVVVIGLGYAYSQFVRGKKEGDSDSLEAENNLVTYLKNQVDGFKEIIEGQNTKINALSKEVSSLRAVIEEKDKTIDKYLAILQNRNPELESFMKDSRESWKNQIELFTEIKNFMHNLNVQMEKSNKDMKITGTVTQI